MIPGRGETPLLFDVVDDPNEARDLAKQHPDAVSRLLQHVQSLGGVARRGGEQADTRPRGDSRGAKRQGGKMRQLAELKRMTYQRERSHETWTPSALDCHSCVDGRDVDCDVPTDLRPISP